jgi:UDPglucose 6-dehydrogenase
MEPGLDSALARNLNSTFNTTSDPVKSVKDSDFIFLCVGTPCAENGEADLRYLFSAIDSFAPVLNDGKYRVLVVKSTIPPSTTSERIIPYLKEKGFFPGELFSVANNPEFLREGKCWDDMINADRIVCGVSDEKAESMLRTLYGDFKAPFFAVSHNTGEYIKYLSNTLLSTMISYSNEMSKIADAIGGISIKDAFKILHLDRRWGDCDMKSYVYPGCGFGGYCLPKDTQAMYAKAASKGFEPKILKYVTEINDGMPGYMAEKIMAVAKPTNKIGILGLSFKPGSDDVRDSSSAKIIRHLLTSGFTEIYAFDPIANEGFAKEYNFNNIVYCNSQQSVCEKADVLVIATAWGEFMGIDKKYPGKPVIDCRYMLER